MKAFWQGLAATALSLSVWMAPTGAEAAVLYRQAPQAGVDSLQGNFDRINGGIQNAESYTLAVAATITGFAWWGSEIPDVDDFVVRLYAALPTNPGDTDTFETLIGTVSQTATSLRDLSDFPIFRYDFTLANSIAADAGTRYLAVYAATSMVWGWQPSNEGDGESFFRDVEGAPFTQLPPDLSIEVLGTRNNQVPEPAPLVLLLAAGGALMLQRRRR